MAPLKVKICGMREAGNIAAVAAMNPDYIGFIEYRPSSRFVGDGFVVPSALDALAIKRVGVFVDDTVDHMAERATGAGYDVVQLHGDESADQCAWLRDKGFEVVKVFRIDDAFDFRTTRAYENKVDVFLFDTRGKLYGGNGMMFDWKLLHRYDQGVPFFLSGGLDAETLKHGLDDLDAMNLYGVDLNSGVEISPGLKDLRKVAASLNMVRGEY